MKTKWKLTFAILLTGLMVTGIVYGDDPYCGFGSDSFTTGSGGFGWKEQTIRTKVFVSDGLNLSTGVSANQTGFNWNINVSSHFDIIECCRAARLKQSWCNYNADDPGCDD